MSSKDGHGKRVFILPAMALGSLLATRNIYSTLAILHVDIEMKLAVKLTTILVLATKNVAELTMKAFAISMEIFHSIVNREPLRTILKKSSYTMVRFANALTRMMDHTITYVGNHVVLRPLSFLYYGAKEGGKALRSVSGRFCRSLSDKKGDDIKSVPKNAVSVLKRVLSFPLRVFGGHKRKQDEKNELLFANDPVPGDVESEESLYISSSDNVQNKISLDTCNDKIGEEREEALESADCSGTTNGERNTTDGRTIMSSIISSGEALKNQTVQVVQPPALNVPKITVPSSAIAIPHAPTISLPSDISATVAQIREYFENSTRPIQSTVQEADGTYCDLKSSDENESIDKGNAIVIDENDDTKNEMAKQSIGRAPSNFEVDTPTQLASDFYVAGKEKDKADDELVERNEEAETSYSLQIPNHEEDDNSAADTVVEVESLGRQEDADFDGGGSKESMGSGVKSTILIHDYFSDTSARSNESSSPPNTSHADSLTLTNGTENGKADAKTSPGPSPEDFRNLQSVMNEQTKSAREQRRTLSGSPVRTVHVKNDVKGPSIFKKFRSLLTRS